MYCNKCGKQIADDSNFCNYCGVAVNKDLAEISDVEKACRDAIMESLKTPGTAKFSNFEVLDKDQYGRNLCYISVDAQNSYGALIRNDFALCVIETENGVQVYKSSISKKGLFFNPQSAKYGIEWGKPKEKKIR